jgi:Phage gp6-like head-tail connector protein
MTLATLAEAKAHLQITDASRDAEVTQFLELASAKVVDYIGARADPLWDETTAPPVVRAATLKTIVHDWQHRGDDSDDGPLWAQLRELLMRTRDPALA